MSSNILNCFLNQMLMEEMFSTKNGARPGVAQICILITDGRSSEPKKTIPMAKKVHDSGIYMFAIGNTTDYLFCRRASSRGILLFSE